MTNELTEAEKVLLYEYLAESRKEQEKLTKQFVAKLKQEKELKK